jgi:hypothetical protein
MAQCGVFLRLAAGGWQLLPRFEPMDFTPGRFNRGAEIYSDGREVIFLHARMPRGAVNSSLEIVLFIP